jgi:hypothetical protein
MGQCHQNETHNSMPRVQLRKPRYNAAVEQQVTTDPDWQHMNCARNLNIKCSKTQNSDDERITT